jgi:ketosteroid isomerase-like protein
MARRSLTPALLAALAGAAVPPLYAASVRALLRRTAKRFMAGEVDAYLRLYSDDVRMIFPGEHSWGREYRGKDEVEGFLRRFLAAGLQGETHEILVNGPPWNTAVCVRFTDEARSPEGAVVYTNRAVLFIRAVWGKVVFVEVYEDTQKVLAFDDYLAGREGAAAAAVAAS